MEINGEREEILNIPETFEKAMYNINYEKYILPEENIQQIYRFIFENEFNIVVIKDNEDVWSYYLTVDEFVNDIISEYISFD